jgi:integrase
MEIVTTSPWDLDAGLMRVKRGTSKHARRWMRIPPEVWEALAPHVAEARERGQARVFPFAPSWIRAQVKRLCREIEVPEVCAHALRGTHATVAIEAGATAEVVARQLGHRGSAVTRRHCLDPAAAIEVAAARVLAQLRRKIPFDSEKFKGYQGGASTPRALPG